jgi:hypothetical protein
LGASRSPSNITRSDTLGKRESKITPAPHRVTPLPPYFQSMWNQTNNREALSSIWRYSVTCVLSSAVKVLGKTWGKKKTYLFPLSPDGWIDPHIWSFQLQTNSIFPCFENVLIILYRILSFLRDIIDVGNQIHNHTVRWAREMSLHIFKYIISTKKRKIIVQVP